MYIVCQINHSVHAFQVHRNVTGAYLIRPLQVIPWFLVTHPHVKFDSEFMRSIITVCEITFVVQGDTLSEGYKICMEMCRFVRTMCLNYVYISQ